MKKRTLLTLLLVNVFFFFLKAQDVSIAYTNPDFLEVCDSTKFEVSLSANNVALENIEVTINFPKGIEYQIGSIINGSDLNVSNLQQPVFQTSDIAVAQTITLEFWAKATCEMVNEINAGRNFANSIKVNYTGGVNEVTTDLYEVETPFLVIKNVDPEVINTFYRGTVTREITIRNTRLGKLSEFAFTDSHEGGLSISTNGTNPSQTATDYAATFDESHFRNIGNRDRFFDLDEELVITETIEILDCGIDLPQSTSVFTAEWGCSNEICQTAVKAATINFAPGPRQPELVFNASIDLPVDFCDDGRYITNFVIENQGDEVARDVIISLLTPGINTSSLRVDSAGVDLPVQLIETLPIPPPPPCSAQGGTNLYAIVRIPNVADGERITLIWESRFCVGACAVAIPPLSFEYEYGQLCYPDRLFNGASLEEFDISAGLVKDTLIFNNPTTLQDGGIYEFNYEVASPILTDSMGVLEVNLTLPCGMVWLEAPILDGQTPTEAIDTSANGELFVTLEYQLPFSSNVMADDFEIGFVCQDTCILNDDPSEAIDTSCDDGATICGPDGCLPIQRDTIPMDTFLYESTLVLISETSYISPSGVSACGFTDCDAVDMEWACETTIEQPDPYLIPGYVDFQTEFYRKNIGLQDDNDDREADSQQAATRDLIRQDRFIPGDTALTKIAGRIVTDYADTTFKQIRFRVYMEGHTVDDGIDNGEAINVNLITGDIPLFLQGSGIESISGFLKVVDESTGNTYQTRLDNPGVTSFQIGQQNVRLPGGGDTLDIFWYQVAFYEVDFSNNSNAGNTIPADFKLAEGDSVYFEAAHRMIYNPEKRILNLRTVSMINLFDESQTIEEVFSCGNPTFNFQLSGYKPTRFLSSFVGLPCGEFPNPAGSGFSIELGMPNFFPFEVRPLASVNNLDYVIPTGFFLKESQIFSLGMQGTNPRYRNEPVTSTVMGNTFFYDLSSYHQPVYDEGFALNLSHILGVDPIACSFDENFPVTAFTDIVYLHDFPEFPDRQTDSIFLQNVIQPSVPNIRMISPQPNIEVTNQNAVWDIRYENFKTHPSPNTWAFVQASNAFSGFVFENTLSGNVISPDANGIFDLGELTEDLVNFQLKSSFDFCGIENVRVIYGWNCDPIGSASEFSCFKDTLDLVVNAPLGELELAITSPEEQINICDTVPYFEVQVFNAGLGSLREVNLNALLPPGLTILEGTSEVEYPSGSGNYFPLNDPNDLGGNNFEWSITNQLAQLINSQLPGVQTDPRHSMTIRFLSFSDCDFIASTPIIFTVDGQQICNQPSNRLSKPSEPIEVDGTSSDYSTTISPNDFISLECGNDLNLNVEIVLDGTSGATDSIFVLLPLGISYNVGSYAAGNNAVSDAPTAQQRGNFTILKWRMNSNLPQGSKIEFSIDLSGFGVGNCDDKLIQIQTVQAAQALCRLTNEQCPILVQTGSAFVTIELQNPIFEIISFTGEYDNGQLLYDLSILNVGSNSAAPLNVDFYIDEDGDGRFSPGDRIDDLAIFPTPAPNGQPLVIQGGHPVALDDLCNVIVVIDPSKNCNCELVELPLNVTVSEPSRFRVCSGVPTPIGFAIAGTSDFFWDSPLNLSCTDCPMPDFQFENMTGDSVVFTYQVLEINAQCQINHTVEVVVYPDPILLSQNEEICQGEPVILETQGATSVTWSGSNISNPNEINPTVRPNESGFYVVEFSNQGGCVLRDSFFVEVTPAPDVEAGRDTSICDVAGATYQLDVGFNPDYEYFWSPQNLLDDPRIHNPTVTQGVSSEFVLTVIDKVSGCTISDSVFVSIGSTPTLTSSSDVTICEGETATLEITGASNYSWSPSAGLNCDSCSVVQASPITTTSYVISGWDVANCIATEVINVEVLNTVQNTFSEETACAGEIIMVFGQDLTRDTMVCDTFPNSVDGCDSIHCVTAIFSATETEEELIFCEGDTVVIFGETLTQSGQIDTIAQSSDGCDSTHTVLVSFLPGPIEAADTFTFTIEVGQDTILRLPEGYSNYSWTPASAVDCATCPEVTISPTDSTIIEGIFSDDDGCSVTWRFNVNVVPQCDISKVDIPNIFSPNGDGRNDCFQPIFVSGTEQVTSLKIFNRWGQKIYEGKGLDACWDGTYNGTEQPTDVYVYRISIGCSDVVEEQTSDLTLIR